MNTPVLSNSFHTLLAELLDGTPPSGGFMLNRGDAGLLQSLARLPAASASVVGPSGSSVAAHVDHLRYGFSLMNRLAGGENPFADADWAASWRTTTVSDAEWARLRQELDDEAHRWLATISEPRDFDQPQLTGVIGSIAHLAYHLGAIRQIDRTIRGPAATA